MKFSNNNRKAPKLNNRKAQFTNPVKLSKPDVQEKNESLGRWHLKVKNELLSSFLMKNFYY